MSPEPAIAVMLSRYRFLRLFGWFAVDEVGLELWFRSWHQTSLQAWIFALLCCCFPAGGSAPQRQSCKWFVFPGDGGQAFHFYAGHEWAMSALPICFFDSE